MLYILKNTTYYLKIVINNVQTKTVNIIASLNLKLRLWIYPNEEKLSLPLYFMIVFMSKNIVWFDNFQS